MFNKKIIFSNFWLKVFSFLIAVVLWFYVLNIQNPQDTKLYKVPISIQNINSLKTKKLKIENQTTYFESIKIKARRLTLNKLSTADFGVRMDLKDINSTGLFIVVTELYKTPSDIQILDQEPESIKLRIVRK